MKKEVTVKTIITYPQGLGTKLKTISDPIEAMKFITEKFQAGSGFTVMYGLYEGRECLDDQYSNRTFAQEDARRLNSGLELQ